MKSALTFLRTTLVGGLLVVVPVWVLVLIAVKVVSEAGGALRPITAVLPVGVWFPELLAAGVLLGVCFLAGLAVRTAVGRYAREVVERRLLERVPGYTTLRSMSEQLADMNRETGFRPALAEIEGGLAPALIVENHPDGRCTVFVPSAPTPIGGSIFIFPGEKVHPVNVPLVVLLKCVSRYGAGSQELLAALAPGSPAAPPPLPAPPVPAGCPPGPVTTGGSTRGG
jgi:uncharacterized membrane protein